MGTFMAQRISGLAQRLDLLEYPHSAVDTSTARLSSPSRPSDRASTLQHCLLNLPSEPERSDIYSVLQVLLSNESRSPVNTLGRRGRTAEEKEEEILEWTVLARIVFSLYGLEIEQHAAWAEQWEEEIAWWKKLDRNGKYAWGGIGGYLLMTFPHRLASLTHSLYAQPPRRLASFTPTYLLSSLFPTTAVPRSTPSLFGFRTLIRLTRLEVRRRITELEAGRDWLACRLGQLIIEGPSWDEQDLIDRKPWDMRDMIRIVKRILDVMVDVIPGSPGEPPQSHPGDPDFEERLEDYQRDKERLQSAYSIGTLRSGPPIVSSVLPTLTALFDKPVRRYTTVPSSLTRPTALTRLWPPLLLLPLLIPLIAPRIPVVKALLRDLKETSIGFWKGWVVEPAMGIIETSLERMVIDLAREKKAYTEVELVSLSRRVREGDLSDVLKLYEEDMKSPLKNAIAGSLVRSLLIQVQKTKVDVDLALSGIDRLLRSQELTFAFVGVAPSFLIVYLLGGWLKSFLTSAGGLSFGANRRERRRASWEGIRRIERLLIHLEPDVPETGSGHAGTIGGYDTQGLILISIGSLREMAKREFKRSETAQKQEFMQDLLDLEDPFVSTEIKQIVVNRMWRTWGTRLGWVSK
ncbi:Nuclear control of ATP synthase 2 [Phaffia rhodozyma]|uniref:Nuclear control of ATP synthase 2 n=1 Tax=Phaffia rhodozyma TaxID=264483 RepID=A0A0F7SGB7_PHARH|nr:Nuclear control of ATP synthase 2 [Phaffia rhodozyma]